MAQSRQKTVREAVSLVALHAARTRSFRELQPQRLATQAIARVVDKLNQEIERGHAAGVFTIAIAFAIVKDIIDWGATLLWLVPYVGPPLALLAQGLGWCISVFLMFFLWGKGWFLTWRIKAGWWFLGFFVDNLPAASALPMNTLMVFYAWHVVRKRSRKAEKTLPKVNRLTAAHIRALDEDIAVLDREDIEPPPKRLPPNILRFPGRYREEDEETPTAQPYPQQKVA